MANFTKLGISMLNMDEIELYLATKSFAQADGIIRDTRYVAGTPSSQIAIAIDDDNRTTVDNAKHLDGHPIEDFMTNVNGNKILENTASIKKTFHHEVDDVKNELQQLRAELHKNGLVHNYQSYNGFYDTFRSASPRHLHQAVAVAVRDSQSNASHNTIIVSDEDFFYFAEEDHIFLYDKEKGKSHMAVITELSEDKQTIVFSPEAPFEVKAEKVEIYRSKGSLLDGSYVFGEAIPVRPGTKELYTALDDDTHWSVKRISKDKTGFAYTFRIPTAYQQNYLARLQIKVKKYGEPGPLKCYIIKEEDIENWRNPEKAKKDRILIAESLPLKVDARLDMHLAEFTFRDPYEHSAVRESTQVKEDKFQINANPNAYPLLKETDNELQSGKKVRYCMIIEALSGTNDSNYYDVTFISAKENSSVDLQVNNTTYLYEEKKSTDDRQGMSTTKQLNAADLYYGITLIEAVKKEFTPFTNGVYTARFKPCTPGNAEKATLMLRIGREGMFRVSAEAGGRGYGIFKNHSSIAVIGEESYDMNGFESSVGKPVVIGTNVRKVEKVMGNTITIDKGLYIEPNDVVYPINYKVRLKAYNQKWDEKTCTIVKDETTGVKHFDLHLKEVRPNGCDGDRTLSDRLIFEGDIDPNFEFTHYEVEIYWEKSALASNTKLIGSIHDLSLTISPAI